MREVLENITEEIMAEHFSNLIKFLRFIISQIQDILEIPNRRNMMKTTWRDIIIKVLEISSKEENYKSLLRRKTYCVQISEKKDILWTKDKNRVDFAIEIIHHHGKWVII